MYKLFLTLRYLRKRRIAYFAIAAVTLCVAMVLVVMSVMGGWLEQVKNRARGLLGDVVVDNGNNAGFPLYQEFIDDISKWPEVVRATPVVYTAGIAQIRITDEVTHSPYVTIVGIRLNEIYDVNAFKQSLFYEKWYPGTTKFDPEKWPKLGIDPLAPSFYGKDGEYFNFVPPQPYFDAWRKSIAAFRSAQGRPLFDADSVPGTFSRLLLDCGRDDLPGRWDIREESALPGTTSGPVVLEPGYDDVEMPGLVLGRDIVARRESDGRYTRRFPKGWVVRLTMVPVAVGGQVDPKPVKLGFRYVDDSRTGVYEIDSRHVYLDFELLQKLMEMQRAAIVDDDGNETGKFSPARASQIQIKLKRGVDSFEVAKRLESRYRALAADERFELPELDRALLADIKVEPWQITQAHIIVPIEKERMLVTILFGIISMVAVALILCILYMIVLQKTRDIGILKAVGGSSGGVAVIWVGYGMFVGVVGAVAGIALGTVFVWNINRVQDFLIWAFDFRVWDMRVYSFDSIPQEVSVVDATAIGLIAVVAATIGALGAARRAALMEPVESIRHE